MTIATWAEIQAIDTMPVNSDGNVCPICAAVAPSALTNTFLYDSAMSGSFAHPSAPAGGTGPGFSGQNGPLSGDSDVTGGIPHTQSPASRNTDWNSAARQGKRPPLPVHLNGLIENALTKSQVSSSGDNSVKDKMGEVQVYAAWFGGHAVVRIDTPEGPTWFGFAPRGSIGRYNLDNFLEAVSWSPTGVPGYIKEEKSTPPDKAKLGDPVPISLNNGENLANTLRQLAGTKFWYQLLLYDCYDFAFEVREFARGIENPEARTSFTYKTIFR